jgi:hypothetical protein
MATPQALLHEQDARAYILRRHIWPMYISSARKMLRKLSMRPFTGKPIRDILKSSNYTTR